MYVYVSLDIKVSHNHRARFDPRKVKKVKAIPLQAWTGPEGSRRMRLPDFKTISI